MGNNCRHLGYIEALAPQLETFPAIRNIMVFIIHVSNTTDRGEFKSLGLSKSPPSTINLLKTWNMAVCNLYTGSKSWRVEN